MTNVTDWSTRSAPWRCAAVITVGAAASLTTGIVHVGIVVLQRQRFHEMAWYSREFVWMAPLAYLAAALPMLVVLAASAALTRHRAVYSLAVTGSTAFAIFGLLLPYTWLSLLAVLVFSSGVGTQLARLTAPRSVRAMRVWRRLAAAGVAWVAALAAVIPITRGIGERRAVAALPAAAAGAPNVLLIILDTVGAAAMSLYGGTQETTPHLQKWARQGVTFDWAYATAPWTLPSHASLFTGQYARSTSANWTTPLDRRDSTLAELLRRRGYVTAGFTANMAYTSYETGLARGFIHFEDYQVSLGQLLYSSSYAQTPAFDLHAARKLSEVSEFVRHPDLTVTVVHKFDRKPAQQVADRFLQWHARASPRPFFAFLNLHDAHKPYFAPPAYQRFTGASGQAAYLAAIAYLDAEVDRVLTALQQRGVLDSTVVVVTADHGELFGYTRGLFGHGHSLYNNVLHVPLMIRYPKRVPAGVRVARAVSLRDLMATVVDLAGAVNATVPGVSLAGAWTGDRVTSPVLAEVSRGKNVPGWFPTARSGMAALLDDALHYIRREDGQEELYAYRKDPREEKNLATDPGMKSELQRLRARLAELVTWDLGSPHGPP